MIVRWRVGSRGHRCAESDWLQQAAAQPFEEDSPTYDESDLVIWWRGFLDSPVSFLRHAHQYVTTRREVSDLG